ncbi:MAG: hypothetical protein M3O02_09950 [Acidobacteriota bacterium]|nr:hypothetical protein [Acidobacteriota bacterium]
MAGFTTITASRIQDGSGNFLVSGRVICVPVNSEGGEVSAISGGFHGPILDLPVTFLVSNGALTTDLYGQPPRLADTALTAPANIAYRISIVDASGRELQGPGYRLVQPTGTTWSLDTYVPNNPLIPTGGPGGSGGGGGTPQGGGGTAGPTLHALTVPATTAGNFTLAHGLGNQPVATVIEMTTPGFIWFQTPGYDATNYYLTASDDGLTANLKAWVPANG